MFGLYSAAEKISRNDRSSESSVLSGVGKKPIPKKPNWFLWGIVLALILILGGKYLMSDKELPPGLVPTEDGEYVLAPDRQSKLDRELDEIDNAIQYALIAKANGYYPCFSCPIGQKLIHLKVGEVWKYGVTRKGEAGRYPTGNYGAPNLLFIEQFTGTYSECLKKERVMIYSYPFLPEVKARDIILIRPPGNKYDS